MQLRLQSPVSRGDVPVDRCGFRISLIQLTLEPIFRAGLRMLPVMFFQMAAILVPVGVSEHVQIDGTEPVVDRRLERTDGELGTGGYFWGSKLVASRIRAGRAEILGAWFGSLVSQGRRGVAWSFFA